MIGDIIIANVLASACLVLLIYIFDINEKEPPWTLLGIFIFSIFATFLFGKLKGILFTYYQWQFPPLFNHFVVAGFFEELLKLIVVLVFVWPLKSFNEETDGIIYFLLVAAGFTVLENVGYSFEFVISPYVYGVQTGQMNFYHSALQKIVLFRAFSGHIFINIVSGYFLGLAKKRHRMWLLIPGFIVSIILHGFWNLTATTGFLGWYALGLFVIDAVLFYALIRMSFYFKFMKRLKRRIKDLIQEAVRTNVHEDVTALMQGILENIGTLRQMDGNTLTINAKAIIEALPPTLESFPLKGKDGLVERLLKVNGILGRGRRQVGKKFWLGLFLMFSVSGFLLLVILMNFM